ncbi:CAP domain-containing protein [Paracoccus onubensis]|uniref:CAP domain-containing protein n=1 Tax=Paracoccus onubensis TaxID=1675788 RepID=UPI00272FCDBA|nr:CAP domain-containing protein [Paracoccus onubensis]MDP0927100.1 CAP domain-containing protein [Paracoccus onubensis]
MLTSKHAILTLGLLTAACAAPPSGVDSAGSDNAQLSAGGDVQCSGASAADNRIGVQTTNIARARAGLPRVQQNAVLARAAAEHACDMAKRGSMTHNGSSSSGPNARVKALGYRPMLVAENIAAGPYDVNQALSVWNASPKHRDNILRPQVRDFGIGHAIGSDGRTHFWAAVYGASH